MSEQAKPLTDEQLSELEYGSLNIRDFISFAVQKYPRLAGLNVTEWRIWFLSEAAERTAQEFWRGTTKDIQQ